MHFLLVCCFSVKMCSAMVFDRPLPICKIHPKEIWRLSRETPVIASRAAGTTDAYRRAFLRWKSFASTRDEIQAFPAKPEHVAPHLQYLMDTTQFHSSVDMTFMLFSGSIV